VAPRSSRLGVSAFARQLTVRRPGGVDIRLRFRPYQRTHRARRSSTNAQSARAGTSVTSIAATAGSSAGAWAWEASAQPATSRWPSVICYPNTPHPDHHGGQGAEPPLPRTPSPQVPSAPRIIKMEVIYRNLTLGFRAILVAAIGQVRWPPPGSLHDRHWAGPTECSTDRVHGSSASKGGIITSRLLQASHRRTYDLRVDRLRQISLRRHGCGDPWSTVGASVVSTLVMNVGRHHLQRWSEQ